MGFQEYNIKLTKRDHISSTSLLLSSHLVTCKTCILLKNNDILLQLGFSFCSFGALLVSVIMMRSGLKQKPWAVKQSRGYKQRQG